MNANYIRAVPVAVLCCAVMGAAWFFGTTAMHQGDFWMGVPVSPVLFFIFVGIPAYEMLHELPRRRRVRLWLPFVVLSLVPTWTALALSNNRSAFVTTHFDPCTPKLAVFTLLNGIYSSVDLVKTWRVRE